MSDTLAGADATLSGINVTPQQAADARRLIARHALHSGDFAALTEALGLDLGPEPREGTT